MEIGIRKSEVHDIPGVLALMHEFAEFEGLEQYCEVTDSKLMDAMFGPGAVVEGLVATEADTVVAYALFYPNFASFRGQRGFYIEDIFVSRLYRSRGLGELMIREIACLANMRGFERIDFLVLDWNRSAIDFYERLGGVADPDERHYKFTDDAFRRLAALKTGAE